MRARVRGQSNVGAGFALLAAAVDVAPFGMLGLARVAGPGWGVAPSWPSWDPQGLMAWPFVALAGHQRLTQPPNPLDTNGIETLPPPVEPLMAARIDHPSPADTRSAPATKKVSWSFATHPPMAQRIARLETIVSGYCGN